MFSCRVSVSAILTTAALIGCFPAADPSPPSTILPSDARQHLGQVITVELFVQSSGNSKKGGFAYLNSERNFLSSSNLAVFLEPKILAQLEEKGIADPGKHYSDKWIRVTGFIQQHKSVTQIKIEDAANIRILEAAPAGRSTPSAQRPPEVRNLDSALSPVSAPESSFLFPSWGVLIALVAAGIAMGYVIGRVATSDKRLPPRNEPPQANQGNSETVGRSS